MLNVTKIRSDFPILEEKIYGKPLVYLDNGATTQKPVSVLEVMDICYRQYNANVHRGTHYLSSKSTDAHENARLRVKEFINASSVEEVIFTRGTTESINLVAFSFGEAFIKEGDEVLITGMEHHSNIVPWQMLCERKGAHLRVVPLTEDGELDITEFLRMLSDKVRLVAVTHVSNVLGTINPLNQIIKEAHRVGAYVLVDGAQSIQHLSVDVQELDCDFFAFSGHKTYGPTGVGVLYGKRELLEKMPPWQGGGEMIKNVTFEKTTYNDLPFKFEAGTPDYVAIIGLGEALNYVCNIGIESITAYEDKLMQYALEQMSRLPGIIFYGNSKSRSSVISFGIEGIHPFDLGTLLDQMGIAIRTGQLCAEPVMQHYGVTSMARVSFAMYNTYEEVDKLCVGIRKVSKLF